jgi:hypothetical protein
MVVMFFITAFNESGKDQNIAFDVIIQDTVSGVTQEIKVPFFLLSLIFHANMR